MITGNKATLRQAAIESTRPNYTANLNNQVCSYQSVIGQEIGQ